MENRIAELGKQNLRRNKSFGKGWERKQEKILTNWLVLLCTFPGDQELLLMQQHWAPEKSERAKRQGRYQERREWRWGKGRGDEERGGEIRKGVGRLRKGVGRACTHCMSVGWALTLVLGKKRKKATCKWGWVLFCSGSRWKMKKVSVGPVDPLVRRKKCVLTCLFREPGMPSMLFAPKERSY